MKQEYFRRGKSDKYLQLRAKFRRSKRKSIQNNYADFVHELKQSKPGQWFSMAKRLGGYQPQLDSHEIEINCLKGLPDDDAAEKIADFFAKTSNEYLPVDHCELPAFLPALPPPQLEELEVHSKLMKLKKTKSTYPIDIPAHFSKGGRLESIRFVTEF